MAASNYVEMMRPETPERPSKLRTPPTTPLKPASTASTPYPTSPTNSENSHLVLVQKRRAYIEHLRKWSRNHDSSPHFQGSIGPEPSNDPLELGMSVKCVLTESGWTDARKHVVIRLFAPQQESGQYTMVVRSGAGWMDARQFLGKEYFLKRSPRCRKRRLSVDASLIRRSQFLGRTPQHKDTIIIRPLFHPFLRLPIELQHYIVEFAINKTNIHRPVRHRRVGFGAYLPPQQMVRTGGNGYNTASNLPRSLQFVDSPTKLRNMFLLSKSLNIHLLPMIFATTNFHFTTTGLTNFLWLAGPENRANIRHITLAFGHYALVHCIRWLAPDPILELFEPQVASLEPPAIQYFWRKQVQDLAREVRLATLTIDIDRMPVEDIPFVNLVLQQPFGILGKTRFITGEGKTVDQEDPRLHGLRDDKCWGDLCRDAFVRYRSVRWHDHAFSVARKATSIEDLERDMGKNNAFFWNES